MSSIIIENRKEENSVKAIGLWHDFFQEDEYMCEFKPDEELVRSLNL